jgi:hypothetical protein
LSSKKLVCTSQGAFNKRAKEKKPIASRDIIEEVHDENKVKVR